MTTEQKGILDQQVKGITANFLKSLVIGTGIGVFTVLNIYFKNEKDKAEMRATHKEDIQALRSDINLLKWQVERLENKK